MTENEISYKVRAAIFRVYKALGPGLLESVYEAALMYELKKEGLNARNQVDIPVIYNNEVKLAVGFRADIIVEDKVIVEIKSIERIIQVHHKTVLTYLRLTEMKLALMVNFCTDDIAKSIYRKVNNL